MKKALVSWLVLFAVFAAFAADAVKTYPAKDAKHHVGENAIVTGKVDGVRTLDSGMTLVNIDGRYPNQAVTVVVRAPFAKAVGDLAGLDGKTISVRGKITDYKGKPQVEIETREAISGAK